MRLYAWHRPFVGIDVHHLIRPRSFIGPGPGPYGIEPPCGFRLHISSSVTYLCFLLRAFIIPNVLQRIYCIKRVPALL